MAHRFPFPAGGFSRRRRRRDLLVPVQEVSRHARRFFDSAEPDALWRWRTRPCCLPHGLTASALGSNRFRSSIALPACAPVYPSRPALRPAPQDSGSGRLARPSLYDSFIRDFLLVSPAHQAGGLRHMSPTCRFEVADLASGMSRRFLRRRSIQRDCRGGPLGPAPTALRGTVCHVADLSPEESGLGKSQRLTPHELRLVGLRSKTSLGLHQDPYQRSCRGR